MSDCPYFKAKKMHMYLPYRVKQTGQTGHMCHGCGKEMPK